MRERPITSRAALLRVLTLTGGGTGDELKARIREKTGGKMTLNNSSLYLTLRALEEAALVIGEERGRGGRPSRFYSLTAKGDQAANDAFELVRDLFDGAADDVIP